MNIGIIGCGLIGQKRANAVGQNKIHIVADIHLERAEALAKELGGIHFSQKWQDVVQNKSVEAVIISTSNDYLAPIASAAIGAGKHVLVEKPAAREVSELQAVANEAASKKNVVVKVGFNHRFHPGIQKAKEMVDSGVLGPLMFVRGRYGHGGRIGYEKEWRAKPEISGGGELIDQGVHLIDLSRWFLGDFIDVEGFATTYFWDMKVDDNAFLNLRTSQGQTAWLHVSCTEWKNLFSFEIYGRHGKLQIDGLTGSYGAQKLTYYKMLPEMGPPEITVWDYPLKDVSWEEEWNEFLSAIREKRTPSGNLEDALAAFQIVDQIYGKVKV